MTIQALLGIAAGILALAAFPIYIRDIVTGGTKPSKVTWWILMVSNIILALSYYFSGARDTIWIPVVYGAGFGIYAFLSIKYGSGGWGIIDILCVIGATISVLLWWLLHSSEIALYTIIAVDLFGLSPTIVKSYREPESESKMAWAVATLASLLNIFAIERWTTAVYLYPIYVFVTNGLVLFFILTRPHQSQSIPGI